MTPSPSSEKTPQPLPEKQLGAVGDYSALSPDVIEQHAKKSADREAEIARLETRASEINRSLAGKVLATLDGEGIAISKKLGELYKKRTSH